MAAGFLLEKEIRFIGGAVSHPAHPFAAIIGGAKVSDKIEVISNLLPKIDVMLIRNTRAVALVKGLLVLGVVTVVSRILDLHVINWMLQQGMTIILVALPVVFQPELRRALEQIGRGRFLRSGQVISLEEVERLLDEVVAVVDNLSKEKVGALIVFEREVGLNDYIDTGIAIDGKISRELLGNIFIPNTPLHGADLGIANDGDADRCLAVDEKGREMDGDQIMLLCALKLKEDGHLKYDTVVGTVMSNIGFHKALQQIGCRSEITAVGDRYVLENMRKNGYCLGGEQSGHIIFSDYNTTGDGLLTAVQLLTIMKNKNKPLSELSDMMVKYPQILKNIRVQTKSGWEENNLIMPLMAWATHVLQWLLIEGREGAIWSKPQKQSPSSDCRLQPACMERIIF